MVEHKQINYFNGIIRTCSHKSPELEMGHINRQVVVDLVEQRKFRKADFPVGPTLIQSAPFKGDRAGEDEWETPTSLGRMTRIRMEHEIDKQPSFRTRFLL